MGLIVAFWWPAISVYIHSLWLSLRRGRESSDALSYIRYIRTTLSINICPIETNAFIHMGSFTGFMCDITLHQLWAVTPRISYPTFKLLLHRTSGSTYEEVPNRGRCEKIHYSDVTISATASQITCDSIACSTVCSGTYQRKRQSSAPLAIVRGIHRWIPLTKGQWRGKCYHLMTSSCYAASLVFVRGIYRLPVDSPHKGPVKRKMFPFDGYGNRFHCTEKHIHHWHTFPYVRAVGVYCEYFGEKWLHNNGANIYLSINVL